MIASARQGRPGGTLLPSINAVTGWNLTLSDLLQVGERRLNMMRMFNAREGFGQDQDLLPAKFFRPLNGGPTAGVALDKSQFRKAREAYYEIAGWNKMTGVPTPNKLEELGLDWIL